MKVLAADDHPLVLAGMRGILAGILPGAAVLPARSLWEALEVVALHPDLALVLLDLRMPGMEGVASVRRIVDLLPAAPVVVVSAHEAAGLAAELAEAGAAGLVPKNVGEPVLRAALERVLAGERFFPPALAAAPPAAAVHPPAAPAQRHRMAARLATLTAREREVLDHLATGLSNKEIARRLGCSDATVKVHVKAILRKLDAPGRAVAIAMVHGGA